MKVSFLKRIAREDFQDEFKPLIDKLGHVINNAFEQIASALNNNISFTDNILCQVKDVIVQVDATGTPTSVTSFPNTMNINSKGLMVIRADNLTDPKVFPTGYPFISFVEGNGQVRIVNVTGLQVNNKYKLRVISIG